MCIRDRNTTSILFLWPILFSRTQSSLCLGRWLLRRSPIPQNTQFEVSRRKIVKLTSGVPVHPRIISAVECILQIPHSLCLWAGRSLWAKFSAIYYFFVHYPLTEPARDYVQYRERWPAKNQENRGKNSSCNRHYHSRSSWSGKYFFQSHEMREWFTSVLTR